MRTTCIGCPSLEKHDGKDYCFYYQGWINTNDPCGNVFEEKPEFTQEEYEIISLELLPKYLKYSIEELDKMDLPWPQEVLEDLHNASKKAKKEMAERKKR